MPSKAAVLETASGFRAAQRRAGDDVNRIVGEGAAIARGAMVGDEMDFGATPVERRRQRLGRKQMSAGAAGRHQHRCRGHPVGRLHHTRLPAITSSPGSCALGRSRVSATSMPMPKASEINDEPP